MKIRTKLFIAPILTAIIFIGGGFFVFENLQSVIVANHIHDTETDELMAISKLSTDLDAIRGSIGEIIFGISTRDIFERSWQDYDSDSAKLRDILSRKNPSLSLDDDSSSDVISEKNSLEIFQAIDDKVQILRGKSNELVDNFANEDNAQVKDEYNSTDQLFYDFSGAFKDMSNDNLGELATVNAMVDAMQKRAQLLIITLFTAAVLISLFLSHLISSRIAKELRSTQTTITEILGGDLSKRIENTSKDEVGELAMAFNNVVEKLQKSNDVLEEKVKERTKTLEAAMSDVEKRIQDRTQELSKTVKDLEQANALMSGREMKMIELKAKIRDLEAKLGT